MSCKVLILVDMIMTRVRPSLFMSFWMCIWAVASGLTGICQDFKTLVVARFFLGVAEAPFYPGALYMLSLFYTKKEIATRISILYTANICGTAFAGLIAIGVFKMDGTAGLEGWRWLFILLGIITFVISVGSAFILPDEPINTRWLTQEERQLAHSRIAADTVERKESTSTFAGLKDAVKDRKLWVLIVMYHFHMAASNFKNFFPTIVGTLGFDRNTTLALTCPPYMVSGLFCFVWAWNSGMLFLSRLPSACILTKSYRAHERANLAHHFGQGRRRFRLCVGLCYPQCRRPLLRHVLLRHWCLRL